MLRTVTEVLRRRGSEGWLVGGSVRDRELGRFSPDLDVAVADDAAAVAAEVATELGAPWFALSERHLAYRVLGRDGYGDVAAVRGGDIGADLALRDFTANAMAVPLAGEGLIDPFGGLAHLRQRRLVAVSERVFADDPLRLMRAPRLCHVLGLRPDGSLVASIRSQAATLTGAAVERVVTEMVLTLAAGRTAEAVQMWLDLGLLNVVVPEITAGHRLEPTLALLRWLDDLLEDPPGWFPEGGDLLATRLAGQVDGAIGRRVAVRLAGLVHALSAREAEVVGRRLKLSGAMVSLLRAASRHLVAGRPGGQGLTSEYAPGAGRQEVLFLWDTWPWEPEVVVLSAAAAAAESGFSGAGPPPDAAGLAPGRRLLGLWAQRTRQGVPRLPVDGHALMQELRLEAGPAVGRALRAARLAWEAGEATTAAEVVAAAGRALEAGPEGVSARS